MLVHSSTTENTPVCSADFVRTITRGAPSMIEVCIICALLTCHSKIGRRHVFLFKLPAIDRGNASIS